MIVINSKKGKVSIPNSWNDLTPEQYLGVISLIYQMPLKDNTSLAMYEFRLLLLELLTGYKRSRKKYSREDQEDINSMLSILAEKLTFVYKPQYKNIEVFSAMEPDTAKALQQHFPFDLVNTEHDSEISRFRNILSFVPVINYNMQKNPLPELKVPRGWLRMPYKIKGPEFTTDDIGVVYTNITAEEYIDAQEYYNLFHQTHKQEYLLKLTNVFYRKYEGKYNTLKSSKQHFKNMETFALGFYHFFQNIQEYFFNHPVYSILYQSVNKTENEKLSLGNIESLYNASIKGYGNLEKMKETNLIDYMNLLVKDLKDAISQLRSYDKKDFQIAKDLNLPIETIKML